MLARRNNNAMNIFDDMFGNVFGPTIFDTTRWSGSSVSYAYTDEGVDITYQVPGYGKEDLELSLEKDVLRVTDKLEKHKLDLAIRLSKNLDQDSIASECKNGILTVNVKFVKPETPERRIIKIG